MCKAWHQYNERSRALALLNSPRNHERLQAPWRAPAFREKALDSTPSARIVEHASGKSNYFSLATLGGQLDSLLGVIFDWKKNDNYKFCGYIF